MGSLEIQMVFTHIAATWIFIFPANTVVEEFGSELQYYHITKLKYQNIHVSFMSSAGQMTYNPIVSKAK